MEDDISQIVRMSHYTFGNGVDKNTRRQKATSTRSLMVLLLTTMAHPHLITMLVISM